MTGGGCWCPGTLWKPHHNPTWQLNVYTHRITLALAQRVEWNGKLSETFLISVVFSVITGNCLNEDNVWTFPLQLHDIFFISAILRQIIFLFICSVLYYTFIKKATLFFNPFFSLSLSFAAAGGWHSRGGWRKAVRQNRQKARKRGGTGGGGGRDGSIKVCDCQLRERDPSGGVKVQERRKKEQKSGEKWEEKSAQRWKNEKKFCFDVKGDESVVVSQARGREAGEKERGEGGEWTLDSKS